MLMLIFCTKLEFTVRLEHGHTFVNRTFKVSK